MQRQRTARLDASVCELIHLHFSSWSQTGGFFETVCDGCPESCVGCSFVEAHVRPTCTSLLEAGVEHATSDGGITKVEELFIYEGYWRATKTSRNINKCFHTKACTGGITDAPGYCLSGYEGRCEHRLV